jgi:hypothetical protein
MRGWIVSILLLVLIVPVTALTGPITANGKTFYVVEGNNPALDSGNEVCAQAGMACVGYTDTTSGACKAAHPGATESSSMSGDKSGVYCDGPPQSGVCSSATNTCHTCPTCTVSVSCNQQIGTLYNEMYVECTNSQPCKVTVASRNTNDFFAEIPSINAQLQGCQRPLPTGTGLVIGNGQTIVDITGSSTRSFTLTKSNGVFTSISNGAASSCTQRASISEQDFASILASSDRAAQVAFLTKQNKITLIGCNTFSSFRLFFTRPIAKIAAGWQAPAQPAPKPAPNCGNIGEQCNNRGCFSGMCGAPKEQNADGQWGFWNHRCIDQRDYSNYCVGRGNTATCMAVLYRSV